MMHIWWKQMIWGLNTSHCTKINKTHFRGFEALCLKREFFFYFVLIHVRKSQEKFKRFIRRGFFTILISAQGPSTAILSKLARIKNPRLSTFVPPECPPLLRKLHCAFQMYSTVAQDSKKCRVDGVSSTSGDSVCQNVTGINLQNVKQPKYAI